MILILLIIFWMMASLLTVPAVRTNRRKQVCYAEIGCFSLEPPWVGFTRRLPAPRSPDEIKLRFYIMTRNTADKRIREWKLQTTDFYKPTLESLNDLDYQGTRKRTAVHVHGMYFTNEGNWALQKKIARAYLSKEDANIVFVKYSAKFLRFQTIYPIEWSLISEWLEQLQQEQLMELTNLKADQIHIIGFSLGVHLAGYIGKRLKNIYRITGLDPAKPFFEGADPRYRLAHTDAEHVDVLHTNSIRSIPLIGLGIGKTLGDVDFYFNNGFIQFGCVNHNIRTFLRKFLKLKLHWKEAIIHVFDMIICSHMIVVDYWAESLENSHCMMWGVGTQSPTDSGHTQDRCAPVGLNTFEFVTSGLYYVPTKGTSPYCNPRYDFSRMTRTRSPLNIGRYFWY